MFFLLWASVLFTTIMAFIFLSWLIGMIVDLVINFYTELQERRLRKQFGKLYTKEEKGEILSYRRGNRRPRTH